MAIGKRGFQKLKFKIRQMIRRAGFEDRPVVLKILRESFRDDPYLQWLSKDSHRKNSLDLLIEYAVDETFGNGEIYLNDLNNATALWNSEKKESLSLDYLRRNLSFLFKMGIKGTLSITGKDKFTRAQFPVTGCFCHLYLIGVLQEARGKGLATELINPMIEKMAQKSIPVFLETANPHNVGIYRKLGFSVLKSVQQEEITIYFMSR
jgi:ribosomal protein S18 acetylase RimI-like enzyme